MDQRVDDFETRYMEKKVSLKLVSCFVVSSILMSETIIDYFFKFLVELKEYILARTAIYYVNYMYKNC